MQTALLLTKRAQTISSSGRAGARWGSSHLCRNLQVFLSSPLIKLLLFFQKTFSREDVAALKSKLQKLKGQSEAVATPSPAPVSTLAELKARLDAAREISAKVQQRKAERVEADAKATETQTGPEPEER